MAKGRLERGTPMLQFHEIDVDWNKYPDLFNNVARVLRDHDVLSKEDVKAMERVSQDHDRLRQTVCSLYEDNGETALEGIESDQFQFPALISLWPFLSTCAAKLSQLVEQWGWTRNICPVCGGRPDFGYLQKGEGVRWLMCSRCDATWIYRRLKCPYCGDENQDDLSYLASPDCVYRLYVCENCHKYLKVIDLRKTEEDIVLPLERLLTLDMDRQAHEMGYAPGHAETDISA